MIPDITPATPTIPEGKGVFTQYGSSIINAPAKKVYEVVRDLQSYNKWNSYITIDTPSGTNDISVGETITINYRAQKTDNFMKVPCEVLEVADEEMRVSWRGKPGVPIWLLNPEKVNKVTARPDGTCLYEVYETQTGPMAYGVKYFLGEKLNAMNEAAAAEFKKYAEERLGIQSSSRGE